MKQVLLMDNMVHYYTLLSDKLKRMTLIIS